MSNVNLYACRDAMWLDQQGGHYVRHVDHMTREGLHSKSDIAAELGWRDYQIAELTRQVSALQTSQDKIINGLGIKGDGPYSKLVIEYVLGLAAENAALKQSEIEFDKMCAKEYGPDWLSEMTETPVTDAAIAEIESSGAEKMFNLVEPVMRNFCNPAIVELAIEELESIAANLRAGRKG